MTVTKAFYPMSWNQERIKYQVELKKKNGNKESIVDVLTQR